MLGYTMEEILGKNIFDIDKYYKPELMRSTMKGLRGQLVRFETKHTRKDGSEIDVEINARGIEIDDEHLIFASSRDISEQLASKKILLAHHAMLENLAEGVYAIDIDNVCTYINESACRLLGFKSYEVIGKNTHELFHNKHKNNAIYPVHACPIHMAANHGISFRGEEWFVTKDGSFVNVHIATAPVFENGILIGSVVSFRDIGEEKELYRKLEDSERSLHELNEQLEERIQEELAKNREKDALIVRSSRLAALGGLISNIAHQWRQPLNAIAIMVQDVKDTYDDNCLTSEYIDKIVTRSMGEINYMSHTIDSLAHFFRPEHEKKFFSIKNIINKTAEIIIASLSSLNIKLELNISDNASVFGYENEFGQVMLSIIENAKDAIQKSNIENGQITITTKNIEDECVIYIKNDGAPIEESIIEKIFDPYFTTKHSSQGTGLGLYMAKMIIEQNMGGSIDVNNIEGGVEFIIRLSTRAEN